MSQAPANVALHCLAGEEAPPDIGADLRRLQGMPPEAIEKLWQVLAPSLAETLAPETSQLLDMFCAAYRIAEGDLARALKSCRFLIREAARLDVPADHFAADIEALCPDPPLIKEVLLAGFEQARGELRRAILRSSLADHGKLLVGAQWRVDTIQASERGAKLGMPVAMLTLHYREGAKAKRITLQVLPDMMLELKDICEQILP